MCIFWADAPAVGNSRTGFVPAPSLARPRTCGEQDAHRVCIFAQPRTHAVLSGCKPTLSFCFPGRGEIPRLRRAIRAPGLCLYPASHARAPAVGNSRTGFVPALSLARTRLVPGASPRMAPVFPGGEKSYLLFPAAGRKPAGQKPRRIPNAQKRPKSWSFAPLAFRAHLRWAIRAPGLCLRPVSHARGWFRGQAHAELLFSRAGKSLASVPFGRAKARAKLP